MRKNRKTGGHQKQQQQQKDERGEEKERNAYQDKHQDNIDQDMTKHRKITGISYKR